MEIEKGLNGLYGRSSAQCTEHLANLSRNCPRFPPFGSAYHTDSTEVMRIDRQQRRGRRRRRNSVSKFAISCQERYSVLGPAAVAAHLDDARVELGDRLD